MNRAVTAAAALGIVGVGAGSGAVWSQQAGQAALQDTIRQIQAELGPDGSFTYRSSEIRSFQRAADLTKVALRLPSGGLWTADHVTVRPRAGGKLAAVDASGIRGAAPGSGPTITIGTLHGADISLPPVRSGEPNRFAPDALSFAGLDLNTIAVAAPGASAHADSIQVTEYGAGQPTTLTVNGFAAPLPNAAPFDSFGVAAVHVSGIDLASALGALARNKRPPQLAVGPVRLEVTRFYAAAGQNKLVTMAQAVISSSAQNGGALSAGNVSVSGLTIGPLDEKFRTALDTLRLPKIEIDLSSPASYRVAGGLFQLAPSISVKDLGKLTARLHLAHVDLSGLVQQHPIALLGRLSSVQLVGAGLTFQDSGLRQRFLAAAEQHTGQPAGALINEAVQKLRDDPTLSATSYAQQVQAALIGFVRFGGKLDITVQPPSPLGLQQLTAVSEAGPEDLLAMVGISVSHQ